MSDEETLQESLADAEPVGTSYLDVNLEDAVDEVIVEAGEYQISVSNARIGQKNDQSQLYLLVYFDISDVENARDFTDVFMLPDASRETAKQMNRRRLSIRTFYQAIGLDFSGRLDVAELKGQTCYAILKVEESPDYGEQNRVVRYVTGA